METLDKCPVCNQINLKDHFSVNDYFLSKEEFQLQICEDCNFILTNPRPEENSLGKYYKSENYISHSDIKKGLVNKIYHIVRKYTIRQKFSIVNKFSSGKNVIDFGSGTGTLLKYFDNMGWTTLGFELDLIARELSIQNYSLKIEKPSEINFVKPGSFQAITLWHVLEHVPDLNSTFASFQKILPDTGTLFVAIPNIDSFDSKYYKKYWAALDVPRHLYHFNHKSIIQLATTYGFHLHKIIPLYFDSFYISLLSEKYKNNKFYFVSGMLLGLLSNILGSFQRKNYSSCLYVFKKLNS